MTSKDLHAPAAVLVMTLAAVGLSAGLLLGAAPGLIGQAYRGESLPVLNAMIRGQAVWPVEHYVSIWGALATRILTAEAILGFLLALLCSPPLQRAIDRRLGSAPVVSRMSRRQVVAASFVILALGGFQLLDILLQREDWPFSSYPMYAGRQRDRIAWLRVYGVTPSGEVALIPERHLRPLDTARLNYSLSGQIREGEGQPGAIDQTLRSLLRLYEKGRHAGNHDGPAIQALRLYQERWRLLPSLANKAAPDERRLVSEVRVAD